MPGYIRASPCSRARQENEMRYLFLVFAVNVPHNTRIVGIRQMAWVK